MNAPRTSARSTGLLTALLVLLAASSAFSQGSVLRVPQEYETIQAAVDAAVAGDTIVVKKGEYPEAVVLQDKTDLTLRGKGKPVILPPTDDETSGIQVGGSTGIEIIGFVVVGAVDAPGINVFSSSDVCVTACQVADSIDGGDGINFSSCQSVTVSRCRTFGGDDEGISLSSCDGVDIDRCRIDSPGSDGVHVASSDNVTVTRTRIENPGDHGLHISSGSLPSTVLFERSRIRDSIDDAIAVSGSKSDLTVVKSRIDGSGGHGIDHVGRALTVEKTTIRNSVDAGIYARPIAGPEGPGGFAGDSGAIEGPVLLDTVRLIGQFRGVFLRANGAVLDHVLAKNSDYDGITVESCCDVMITQCKVVVSGGAGVRFEIVNGSTLERTTIKKASTGLDVDNVSSGDTLDQLKIVAPTQFGIIAAGDGSTYTDNTVRKAGQVGFSVTGSGNTITGNKVTGSGEVDHSTVDTATNTYEDNVFGTTEVIG